MVKHNNAVPNGHFHKNWQKYVRTNFGQVYRKQRRHSKRVQKIRKSSPKPADLLYPLVHCPSIRYHSKVRLGGGFSAAELKAAKINKQSARTIGIKVDHRRRMARRTFLLNLERLKSYMSRLVLYPLSRKQQKKFLLPLRPLEKKLALNCKAAIKKVRK